MAKLAQLPANDRAPERDRARTGPVPRTQTRYFAFLSYSHKDEDLADWLHGELEDFRVPSALAGKLTPNGVIPKRLTPVFRDEHELAAADDLGEEIEAALASSQFLIVLCSPNSAKSRWTNAEIDAFKRTRPDGCVLAAIAGGEPFASEMPEREEEECFPPALRQKYDRRGRPTSKRAEPLAADLREEGDGRRMGFLKLVAGMLGVGLDDLVQRETTRRHRRLAWVTGLSLLGMIIASALAIAAIQARDAARDQRREAEGLVAFMLGDLKDKLEPIGRLDALDGVGARVLAYYSKQDTSELSDAGLLQRSRALSLTAEVADLRGDLDSAQRLYREAAEGTGEAVRRNPNDAQRLYDHAQNIYYFGELAAKRGQYDRAEAAFREYKRLAERMVAIGPDNIKWRMEVQYAEVNLGIVLLKQRRFAVAAGQFANALQTIKAVASVDPKNAAYQKSLAESLAWLAEAELAQGKLRNATAHRQQQVALLERLANVGEGDVEFRQKLIPARQKLGNLLAISGEPSRAMAELRKSVQEAQSLLPAEPDNTKWLDFAASAKLDLASLLLASGHLADAQAETESACEIVNRLLTRDTKVVNWRTLLRSCLLTRAEVALATGSTAAALSSATQGVKVAKSISSGDGVADRFAEARALRILGDVYQRAGDSATARLVWTKADAAIPRTIAEWPEDEMAEHAKILRRLDRTAELRPLIEKLTAMGFRSADRTI